LEAKESGLISTWSRLTPTEKQKKFFKLDNREAFFGGAAGGGKSVALLMAAMRFIEEPGYAALILRKDFARLELAGGLIPRSHQWFGHSEQATWVASRRQWIFRIKEDPSRVPATIMFGYLSRPLDKFRYASSEFQYIAFDELTDFTEEDYLFMFSRLRRNTHVNIPLRMRSASNPGGPGHAWVKERFVEGSDAVQSFEFKVQSSKAEGTAGQASRGTQSGEYWEDDKFHKEGRIYLPSRIWDNPHLDEEEYRESLLHLPPVERERLMNGDWDVQAKALIHADWLRYYVEGDGQLELLDADKRCLATIGEGKCRRFVTVDPAGTAADRTREERGGRASWTVAQVWEQPRGELERFLILRHQVREQVGFEGLCSIVGRLNWDWRPEKVWIEDEKLGRAVRDMLKRDMAIECISTEQKDKVTRAGPLIMKLERGEVFLPRYENSWRTKFERELLGWTGNERQVADQIDAAAYAAIVAERRRAGVIRVSMGAVRA
jgi:phage terminase large subunit-like protein